MSPSPTHYTPNIVYLPLELLSYIFNLVQFDAPVRWDTPGYFEKITQNTIYLKNIRICCRRFAQVAAPLLFHTITCSILRLESLEELERLSQHPFAKYVKVLHIRLGFFHSKLASDTKLLATYFQTVWSDYIQKTRPPQVPASAAEEAVEDTIQHWVRMANEPYSAPDSRMDALFAIKAEYRRRQHAEHRLRVYGEAVGRFTEAVARMPAATRLVLADQKEYGLQYLGSIMTHALSLGADKITQNPQQLKDLATPLSWLYNLRLTESGIAMSELYCDQPFHLLSDLPVAVHRAGIRLKCFRILGLQIPSRFPGWHRTEYGYSSIETVTPLVPGKYAPMAPMDELEEACRSLEVLELTPKYINGCCDMDMHTLANFRYTVYHRSTSLADMVTRMFTHRMRHLHLDCLGIITKHTHWGSCDVFFKSEYWPKLETLHVEGATMRDTTEFLKAIRELRNLCQLRLNRIKQFAIFENKLRDELQPYVYMLSDLRDETPRLRENALRLWGVQLALPIQSTNVQVGYQPFCDSEAATQKIHEIVDRKEAGQDYSPLDDYLRGATDVNPLVEHRAEFPCF